MVLPDQRENGRVASGNADLVMAGVRAEVNQPPDSQVFFGKSGPAGDVQDCIGLSEQRLRLIARQTKPGLVGIAPPVGPALVR